jgi:hypothetical protein
MSSKVVSDSMDRNPSPGETFGGYRRNVESRLLDRARSPDHIRADNSAH